MPGINPPQAAGGAPALPTYTFGSFGLSANALTMTTGGTTNTKGATVSLGTLTQAIDQLHLHLGFNVANRALLLDVYRNGVLIAQDVPFSYQSTGVARFVLEQRIEPGEITIRGSGSAASMAFTVFAYAASANVPEVATLMEPIGPVAAGPAAQGVNVSGLALNTPSAWVQLNAVGIANAIRSIRPSVASGGDTSRTSAYYLLEVATDAAGTQMLPVKWLIASGTASVAGDAIRTHKQGFPAGTQFWVRLTALTDVSATAPESAQVQIHGIR